MKRSIIRGVGSYLPEKVLTNTDLAQRFDTSDEWITQRTGIKKRHIAADGEMTSHLGLAAARKALEASGLEASDIDLIVLATATPDQTFPATAVTVQAELGIRHGSAFDVQAVCSGFVYAVATADALLSKGAGKRALVIGAETFSRILDWQDRSTAVLFGDGAGAMVIETAEQGDTDAPRGILSCHLRSDGTFRDKLYVDGGPSSTQTTGHLRMEGREVFRHAVSVVEDVIFQALEVNGLSMDDLDWFVPHQANRRIIESSAKKFGVDESKVVLTVQDHANTSAASIPLALDVAIRDGRIQSGHLVMLEALGGGFSWGSVIVRW